jgi:hypothetical protein
MSRVLVAALLVSIATAAAGCARDGGQETDQPDRSAIQETTPAVSGPLRRGIPWPEVVLWDLDEQETTSGALTGEGDALVFFLSTTCDVCEALMQQWRELDLPDHLPMFAVLDDDLPFGRKFVEEKRPPFPVYLDRKSVFTETWSVDAYPTVAGVSDGFVVFARRGIDPTHFTPARAETLLMRGKRHYGK